MSERLEELMRYRQTWRRGWADLREMVQGRPPSDLKDKSADEILEKMRRTREEVFDAAYGHLYR